MDILRGHPDRGYQHFRMSNTTFIRLRNELVGREYDWRYRWDTYTSDCKKEQATTISMSQRIYIAEYDGRLLV
ncbi:hypothetical protein ACMD2_13955 [Ananas comosus]|uniref:Uncharacterized protein n=1 Tax=Ananas comosus TaxID=4615 RepID=A0A199UJH0_ANACO|nr:hypothetical protein ACMD2_13955 [Ananas comosus]